MTHLPLSRVPSLARDKTKHKYSMTFCKKKKKKKKTRERGGFGMRNRLIGVLSTTLCLPILHCALEPNKVALERALLE
jgi:hypothetical protein